MNRYIFIILLKISISFSLFSQSVNHDFPTMRWHKGHGLNSTSVTDLEVDSKGRIWVSNIDGIYLHKGDRLQNINTLVDNSPFDDPIQVYDIYIDKNDRLWIGTYENGLLMYDINTNTLTHYDALFNEYDQLKGLRIYSLHMLNDSTMRFTSHTHGLIDYHINQDSFELLSVYTDSVELERLDGFQLMLEPLWNKEYEVVENWYSALTGMVHYDTALDSFIYYDNGAHIRIRKSMMDSDSIAWGVTYGQGLFSFNLKNKEFTNHRCTEGEDWSHGCLSGESIAIYNDSIRLIDSGDKIYAFNTKTKAFKRFMDYIPNSSWSGTTSDMKWIDGELWMASWSSSLYRHFLDDHGVRSVSASKWISDIYVDNRNDRYISISQPNLITFHNENDFREIHVPEHLLGNNYLEGVAFDAENKMWILSNDQVIRFDPIDGTFSAPFYDVLSAVKVDITFRKILEHPNGTLWMASHDGTIFTFDPKTMGYRFFGGSSEESYKLEYQYRARLEEISRDGYVWFSAQDGFFGISPYDENHKFFRGVVDRNTKKPVTALSPSIAVGKKDKIYFGAKTNEIYVIHMDSLDGGMADKLDIHIDLPVMSIRDMKICDNGFMWIASKHGLIQVDLKSNKVSLYGDTHRLHDLDEIELKEGKYPIVTSHNNFLIVDPDRLQPFPGTPNIQLVAAELDSEVLKRADGKKLSTGDLIHLGPDDNFLRIQFNDFNYVSQMPKSYAIKVEGLHDEWIDLKKRTDFGISGLPGGTSEVWVKSKLSFQTEYSDPVKLLVVDVTPPLLQRKSFWAFCFGLLLVLIFLGYRYRLKQMNEKQNLIIAFNKQLAETEMKALRAQMNPHFLFNVLNAIKLNVQKNEQENAIDFITDFSKLIRNVLQNSGKKRITLAEELEALELYIKIERKRFSTSFEYDFTVDESIGLHDIDIPPMLLQPYVENAIWHGILHKSEGKGKIKVEVKKIDKSIVIEIVDNGIGREKANKLKLKSAQKSKSMGMQITRDRMAISNRISSDRISVNIIDLFDDDGNSKGTKVIVTLELEK